MNKIKSKISQPPFDHLDPLADFLRYHAILFSGKLVISRQFSGGKQHVPGRVYSFSQGDSEGYFSATRRCAPGDIPGSQGFASGRRVILPVASIPFFAGAPGFVSKIFLVNEPQTTFCGLYEWTNEQAASAYIHSYPRDFMQKNSLPGSPAIRNFPR